MHSSTFCSPSLQHDNVWRWLCRRGEFCFPHIILILWNKWRELFKEHACRRHTNSTCFAFSLFRDGGLAEQVFDSIENKDGRAYAALIQGMAKVGCMINLKEGNWLRICDGHSDKENRFFIPGPVWHIGQTCNTCDSYSIAQHCRLMALFTTLFMSYFSVVLSGSMLWYETAS